MEDFKSTIRENGYSENDFTLNEQEATNWDRLVDVPIERIVTVKRISTQKEHDYNSKPGTHWVVDFENDLKQGYYD